jgi:gluconate:H+ symporter, GntP family
LNTCLHITFTSAIIDRQSSTVIRQFYASWLEVKRLFNTYNTFEINPNFFQFSEYLYINDVLVHSIESLAMIQGPVLLAILVLSVLFIVVSTSTFRLHPFLVLLLAAIGVGMATLLPLQEIIVAIKRGFGDTLGNIGIVIIAGTIIGVVLERTGASLSMANFILRLVGKQRSPLAMSIAGYVVGIPIFCDSGFVVLSPLNNALAKLSKTSMTVMAFALAGPLYVIHCLIPPHPGPTAAAGVLNADLGMIILIGIVAGIPAVVVGLYWALKFASRYYVEAKTEVSFEEIVSKFKKLPSPALSFSPIVLPIVLIGLGSFARLDTNPFGTGEFASVLSFLGDPTIALLLGVFISLSLIKKWDSRELSEWMGDAIKSAGPIIAITGAGGAFGYMLRVTPIGDYLGNTLVNWDIGLLLPFVLAAALKTAQGSSTVSVITTSSLMVPILPQLGIDSPTGIVFTVLAMGAGSMVVSHANDSYFWVVSKFSNLDVGTAYKTYSTGTIILGCVSMITIYILARIVGI